MPITRREFIAGLGAVTGIRFLSPIVVRAGEALGQTLPDPALSNGNRVVVIFLQGGNDGLNTVIPRGGAKYDVYRKVRPSIAYDPSVTAATALDLSGDADQMLGLNPKLTTVHSLYAAGRAAIVQGVDYPNHNYSHFTSTDIWESGQPSLPYSGWLGRHLDRAGVPEGSLRGLGVGYELPLILRGDDKQGVEVSSIKETFFSDGTGDPARARHNAFGRYGDAFDPVAEPLRYFVGQQARNTVALVDALERVQAPPTTANRLANSLLTARTLLQQNFGVECVFVAQGGYDTHTNEVSGQEKLLSDLDGALEAFFFGTLGGTPLGVGPLPSSLASGTLVMTTSEFGRRIGENGAGASAGTDHGAAAPLVLFGPPTGQSNGVSLVPGLHGDHPNMGSVLAPVDNLTGTTELRRVYQAVLQSWLGDPDPVYDSSAATTALPGLFA